MNPVEKQTYYLLKKVRKALRRYSMIEDGDRILVAVSGGKDSLALLTLLQANRENNPIRYECLAVHVEQGEKSNIQSHRDILGRVFREVEVRGLFEKTDSSPGTGSDQDDLSCFRCSYERRKILFQTARREGCNKVALGHHADDIAETTLLNLVYHGRIETMSATRRFFDGELTVIRPLLYVPEREVARFARTACFPTIECLCSYSADSKRAHMKRILLSLRKECPNVITNLNKALEKHLGKRDLFSHWP